MSLPTTSLDFSTLQVINPALAPWSMGGGGGGSPPTGTGFVHVTGGVQDPASVGESGTGNVARVNSPSFTTPALGTPSAVNLTNGVSLPIVGGTTGTLSVLRGGTGVTTSTGTGDNVLSASPTFTGTAVFNAITVNNVNKLNITQPATVAVLTIANNKSLNCNNTLTFSGVDGSGLNIGSGGTLGSLAYLSSLTVPDGGTGKASFTAYSVVCGGTTSGGNLQNVSSVGTSGQVLTSNGAGALPTFQTPSGGGGSATWTEAEVDFGTIPRKDGKFTITDGSVTGTSKIAVLSSGKTATGRVAGDDQWDHVVYAATPGTGTFTVYANASGRIIGKRKLQYQLA